MLLPLLMVDLKSINKFNNTNYYHAGRCCHSWHLFALILAYSLGLPKLIHCAVYSAWSTFHGYHMLKYIIFIHQNMFPKH